MSGLTLPTEAWSRGYADYGCGGDCPYVYGSAENLEWRRGFDAARRLVESIPTPTIPE